MVNMMATAFDLLRDVNIERAPRPVLRLVEPLRPAALDEPAPSLSRPLPPAWLIAPSFRAPQPDEICAQSN